MTNQSSYIVLGVAAAAVAAVFVWNQSGEAVNAQGSASPYPVDLAAGEALYAQSCAVCHGANLEGAENWRTPGDDGSLPAPPHNADGHTWHHPDSLLFTYTKLGGKETMAAQGMEFNSGMPGFGEQLSDEEIWNILAFIKSTWPERERTVQADRTAQDIASKGE